MVVYRSNQSHRTTIDSEMKNFIILQIQSYNPTNGNLKFMWNLLSGTSVDSRLRKRIDRTFDDLNVDSDNEIQEKVFCRSFRELISHFRVDACGRRATAVDYMVYTPGNDGSYKLQLGRRKCTYFNNVRDIPNLQIRYEEVL